MHQITTSGLDIIVVNEIVDSAQRWSTVMQAGLWSGVLLRGAVFCSIDDVGEATTTAESVVTFRAERDTHLHHRALEGGSLTAVFVRVSEAAVDDLLGDEGAAAFGVVPCLAKACGRAPGCPSLQAVAWQMLTCQTGRPGRRPYLIAKGIEFLSAVVDDHEVGSLRPAGPSAGLTPGEVARVMEARDIILADLAATPSVADLARRVGLNARKLTRGFEALFGTTVYAFVKTSRLERAKSLIESGAMSVAEAAYATNYHPGHLSTEFRRRFGVAPSQLRRAKRGPGTTFGPGSGRA